MKLTVLVPSEEYKSFAGARIRYDRIRPHLEALGIQIRLEDIGQFQLASSAADMIVISKCHDARSLIAAAALSQCGKPVGVDLFDDYFSDPRDSRLLRYRDWLKQLIGLCDFALCSTRAMADVVAHYREGLPTHILNDPAPTEEESSLAAKVAKKLAEARSSRRIRIAWFGIGDNPYFPVGLVDLSAYGATLSELSRSGMDVELTVLTNPRALTADGLALIEQLPIPFRIEEWSERAERDLLGEALVAFLPVNAQAFSRTKSLNRAITALAAGCQVLSAGYPLYAALGPLIYRDARELLLDIDRESLRLSAETCNDYRRIRSELASAEAEASKLAAFLRLAKPAGKRESSRLCLIHGHSTRPEAHDLVRAVGGLSVASPYCSARLDFDVVFQGTANRLKMLVSPNAARHLNAAARSRLREGERVGTKQFRAVGGDSVGATKRKDAPSWLEDSLPFQLATYASTMRQVEQRLSDTFGPCRTVFSEISTLPFSVACLAN